MRKHVQCLCIRARILGRRFLLNAFHIYLLKIDGHGRDYVDFEQKGARLGRFL